MNWIIIALRWYLALFFLGIIFVPFIKRIFGRFFSDFGYPFAKTLAILLLSYTIFVLATIKLLPFSQLAIFSLIFIFILFNYLFLNKKNSTHPKFSYTTFFIIFEEILFLSAFLFWVYVRNQEPSIRGLEKFMDFGFINSILRAKFFPPLDMWLSADLNNPQGYPINYYYFGHLTGAFLIKLTGIKPTIGYNLILATIFGLGITQTFSLVVNIVVNYLTEIKRFTLNTYNLIKVVFLGLLGSYIVNFGGNLHTIYLFTSGYPNDKPVPFWQILSWYNPTKYWYPNATRFIPFTIHEFPSYSYVVADLHGHVFDIPFVLLTLSIIFVILLQFKIRKTGRQTITRSDLFKKIIDNKLLITIFLGFLIAVHYMTNAFDGPIYILLCLLVFLMIYGISIEFLIKTGILLASFVIFSLPFSINFSPFATRIGVNCSPGFLTDIGQIGPFLFEKGNCQTSPLWMLLILWGFFLINFALFIVINYLKNNYFSLTARQAIINIFILILFSFGTFLIIIPEFFYIKDIYPAHFRANTMFKLGYQAFIIMGIASAFTFFQMEFVNKLLALVLKIIFIFFFIFIFLYIFFAVPSYYGNLDRPVELDGSKWLETNYPEDKEIIEFFNRKISGQPVILEAQGDSYTDYERISAYTGLPTVAGWWVHEWLWRGSADVVGKKIPDIVNLYESPDVVLTKKLINQYKIKYIVVSKMEKQKYPKLYQDKFKEIAKVIFKSTDGNGLVYQIK